MKGCFDLRHLHVEGLTVRNNVFMAPMAGVTDRHFRALVWEHGCGLTFSEMVSAKSIVYGNKKTWRLMDSIPEARPWAVQFFGREPDILCEAIKMLEEHPFDIVDINMGCPMPKIVNNGEGAALMRDPRLAAEMVSAAKRASKRPVSVKIRLGFSQEGMNAVHVARAAQDSGAAWVAVHGRTREQYYAGRADWDEIARVRACLKIPVIGNGDIFTPLEARDRLGAVDGIMLARGALGNPWLFSRTIALLETGNLPPEPSREQIVRTALRHLRAFAKDGGAPLHMRKHLAWYTKGFPGSAGARRKINEAGTLDEMEAVLVGLL